MAPSEALAGWQVVEDGRSADAKRIFDRVLAARPGDPIALAGRASVAYERGLTQSALDDYAALLLALAPGGSSWTALLAPLAAGRLMSLSDEVGAAARERLQKNLRPAELARAAALPWQARLVLAHLAAHLARQADDADGLVGAAAADGCAALVFDAGLLGPLPTLDLDASGPMGQGGTSAEWRPLTSSGCRLDVPAAPDGRAGARLLRAAIEVPAGSYEIVLDYAGQGRIVIDGGAAVGHGAIDRYGPRVSGVRVALGAGRHDLEIRIANKGGRAALALLVLGPDGAAPARFVDPRPPRTTRPSPVVMRELAAAPAPASGGDDGPGTRALVDYCTAYEAELIDAADLALETAARLRERPRFALGLALAGVVARDDPTRPSSFARDAARRFMRAAVAVDPSLARVWQSLASVELDDDRPREALEAARAAGHAAPTWWAPDLAQGRALAAQGLDFDADQALAEAARKTGAGDDLRATPCSVIEALRQRAEDRRALADETRLGGALSRCGGQVEADVERLRARGEIGAAIAVLRAALRIEPDRDDLESDLALLLAAAGRSGEALAQLASLVAREPTDPLRRVHLADVQAAAGQLAAAHETMADAVNSRPDVPEVRRAARALGVALPLDGYRVDGRAAIRAFEAAGSHYAAPAVMVLDREVMRVFSTGAMMSLTHQIVRVDSKEAIDRWGEVAVPAGTEILSLRTHKSDGSTREPEEISGKESISAADLAIGDYVEWELLETRPPSTAFAPGFLSDRFYFQSFDAPLARSELLLIVPAGLPVDLDRRAGAPRMETRLGTDGTRIMTFAATRVPQLYAERAAVLPIEYAPSVRASSGVGWRPWARYVDDELSEAVRSSPEVRAQARQIEASVRGDRAALAAAVVAWVTDKIEATEDFADPASFTLARGRGSRIALALALARELRIPAWPVLARSRLVADPAAATPPQELDDFADTLLEMDVGAPGKPALVFGDLRLRHAAFGYLPPGLDGAPTLSLPEARFGLARSIASEDRRTVDMTIRLDEHGGGVATATEDLVGWPALEWAELVDQIGADRTRLRQDFEQRWLGVQFPGARLRDLDVDIPRDSAGRLGTARLRYSFVSTHLGVPVERGAPGGREMRIDPTFFRSQPGRRFAAEPQRATALVLGFDVPVRMTATVELPGEARLDDPGLRRDVLITRSGGYRFVEERAVRAGPPGRPNVLVLHRESALPIMRVSPGDYAAVAADLRRVDGVEQEEIRIPLGPGGRAVAR